MGIDLLDMMFRIESKFGTTVTQDELTTMVKDPRHPDIMVGDILDFILAHPSCRECHYDLRGHARSGRCPECGAEFCYNDEYAERAWEELREIISTVGRLKKERIHRQSRLLRDLGLS